MPLGLAVVKGPTKAPFTFLLSSEMNTPIHKPKFPGMRLLYQSVLVFSDFRIKFLNDLRKKKKLTLLPLKPFNFLFAYQLPAISTSRDPIFSDPPPNSFIPDTRYAIWEPLLSNVSTLEHKVFPSH